MLNTHWDETRVCVIALGLQLLLEKKWRCMGRESQVNLNRPLRMFSLLKSSDKLKHMTEKNPSVNLSFNHFCFLAYKFQI